MRTDLLSGSAIALNQLRYATMIASQNINNADNPYYSRNVVNFGTDQSGYLTATSVRMNNFFLTTQLHSANSDEAYADRFLSFAGSVDKIITGIVPSKDGDSKNPILGGIDDISEALASLATTDSNSARSSLLSRIDTLISNTHSMQDSLDEFKKQVDAEVNHNAKVLNNQAKQLAEINKRLMASDNDPNLLTQRDALLGEMSKMVDIDVTEKPNGAVDVSIAGGYPIVSGMKSSAITAEKGAYGDELYIAVNGDVLTNHEKIGGALGGNLDARENVIKDAERQLSKALLGFMSALNTANEAGFKKDGSAGTSLVDIPNVNAMANINNTGGGNFEAALDPSKIDELTTGPIEIEKTASGYLVTDTSTGKTVTSNTSPIEAFGYKLEAKGTMNAGDKFVADPLKGMMEGAELVAGADDIAAAANSPVVAGDVGNLANLAKVADSKIFNGGDDDIYEEISNVFVNIGNNHVSAKQNYATNITIKETAHMNWANLSGVNTQEEELNMMKFQQIFQSVSKVIESDNKMFDSILGVV